MVVDVNNVCKKGHSLVDPDLDNGTAVPAICLRIQVNKEIKQEASFGSFCLAI
ncbi:unnamed protein product [Arabidopsis halleri]